LLRMALGQLVELVRLEEPPVDTFSLFIRRRNGRRRNDKVSLISTTLIDVVMASRDVTSMAERTNLSIRKFLIFVAVIARATGETIDAIRFSRTSFQKARNKHYIWFWSS
jgi:hypothetical protein